ncbi:MAG: 5-formyltetrahydrofolate cyclo-ligase [Clostridia bacterium]|nr:5-formyltetrahydrofolate cyclo-ligase [Clostridia bacterium]
MSEKELFRKEVLKTRKILPPRKAELKAFEKNTFFKDAKVVFTYISFENEISTIDLMQELLKKKRVVVPYCTDKEGSMICVEIKDMAELKTGSYGILEPCNPVDFDKNEIDFCIVPGLAFDSSGGRIGFGKGYYDRFLDGVNAYKIGICHKELFFANIPKDESDILMDEVITF